MSEEPRRERPKQRGIKPKGARQPGRSFGRPVEAPTMQVPMVARFPAGWRVIGAKEFAEHLLSIRFLVLIAIMGLVGVAVVYILAGNIRDAAQQIHDSRYANGQPFPVFLILFTFSPGGTNAGFAGISFAGLITLLLGPLLGLAFGFDAISNERSEGTLPRLVSQPIHRDDVINGKFIASLAIVALILGAVMVILAGIGIFQLGVFPAGDAGLRLLAWYVLAVLYIGFWLALATLFSVVFRRAATAVLVVLGVWLVVTFFGGQIATVIANFFSPAGANSTVGQQVSNLNLQLTIARVFPPGLFNDMTSAILDPRVTSLNYSTSSSQAIPTLLPLSQSLLLIWPYIVTLLAMTAACFAIAYVTFMRQEVRA